MKIGISTGCLYSSSTEAAVRLLLDEGFRLFEIFFNTFSELEPDYLDKLKYMLDCRCAHVCSVHPFTSSYESFLLFSGYERRFRDGLRLYEMYFRTAQRIGADKVVLHGIHDSFSAAITEDEYFRRFALLSECAKEYSVMLLQENVNLHRSNNIKFLKSMKEKIPDSSYFVLDTKQAVLGNHDPCAVAELMGNKLKHLHISDRNSEGKCVLPGKGGCDYRKFFDTLKKIGYDGDVMIEVYRFSYDEISELGKALEFLNQYI